MNANSPPPDNFHKAVAGDATGTDRQMLVVLGAIFAALLVLLVLGLLLLRHLYREAIRRQREQRNKIIFGTLALAAGLLKTYVTLSSKPPPTPIEEILKLAIDRSKQRPADTFTRRRDSKKHHSA